MSSHTEVFEKIFEMAETLQEAQDTLQEQLMAKQLKESSVIVEEMINVLNSIESALETDAIKKRLSENQIMELNDKFKDLLERLKMELSTENYDAMNRLLNEDIPPAYEEWKSEIYRELKPLLN